MCLLVQQPASTAFTDEFLADVYIKNKDGLGVMYADGGKLHVFKCLPANAQDFIDFYRNHAEGRDCVWHARMQTHGDIDMDNCHPYKVTDDIWLAHNGILSMGNDLDRSRSDTWHFIHYVLRPALHGRPELIKDPEFQSYLGQLIGSSNKFGLVSASGEVVIINRKSGVEFEGAWLSNTYAWSPSKFGFRTAYEETKGKGWYSPGYSRGDIYGGYSDMYTTQGRYGQYARAYYEDAEEVADKTYASPSSQAVSYSATQIRPYIRAAYNSWMRRGDAGVEQWIKDAPHKASAILTFYYNDVDAIDALVEDDPEEAAVWISDLFRTDSVAPSMTE